jgi:hypothetical protein
MRRRARWIGVILSAALALSGCELAEKGTASQPRTVEIAVLGELQIPWAIEVQHGESIRFAVTNASSDYCEWILGDPYRNDPQVLARMVLPPGGTSAVTLSLAFDGFTELPYYCREDSSPRGLIGEVTLPGFEG